MIIILIWSDPVVQDVQKKNSSEENKQCAIP